MFKKSKQVPTITPPAPPTAEQIIEDMKTFHVEIPVASNTSTTNNQQKSIEVWWESFEQALQNFEALKELNGKLDICKTQLQTTKVENETQAKILKAEIERQQAKAREYLEQIQAKTKVLEAEVNHC